MNPEDWADAPTYTEYARKYAPVAAVEGSPVPAVSVSDEALTPERLREAIDAAVSASYEPDPCFAGDPGQPIYVPQHVYDHLAKQGIVPEGILPLPPPPLFNKELAEMYCGMLTVGRWS